LTKELATKEKLAIVLSAPIQGEAGGRGVKAMLPTRAALRYASLDSWGS
jgi:hypothetical protein